MIAHNSWVNREFVFVVYHVTVSNSFDPHPVGLYVDSEVEEFQKLGFGGGELVVEIVHKIVPPFDCHLSVNLR